MKEMIIFKRKLDGHYVSGAVSLLLFLGSSMYLALEINRNRRLKEDIKKIKLEAEVNLSEKLDLEKEIEKLKSQIILIERGYEESNQTLATTFQELDETKKKLRINRTEKLELIQLRRQKSELFEKSQALELQLSNCKTIQLVGTTANSKKEN